MLFVALLVVLAMATGSACYPQINGPAISLNTMVQACPSPAPQP